MMWGRRGWLAMLAVSTWTALATACSPSHDDPGEPAPPPGENAGEYCAPLGPHLTEICQATWGTLAAYLAADARKSCRGLPIASERNCLLRMKDCSEQSWTACNAPSRSFVCAMRADCPGDLLCDVDYEECVECLQSEDCEAGSLCDGGLCIPEAYVVP